MVTSIVSEITSRKLHAKKIINTENGKRNINNHTYTNQSIYGRDIFVIEAIQLERNTFFSNLDGGFSTGVNRLEVQYRSLWKKIQIFTILRQYKRYTPGSESVLQIVKLTLNFIRQNCQRLQVALVLHVRSKITPSFA